MKRSRFLIPILGAGFFALSLVPAQAQGLRSMRQNFQTSGFLSWSGQNQNVRNVRVELDEDGDARLKFDTQNRDSNWGWREGDWLNWNQNLEIDGVWLRDERGITIDLRRGLGGQNVVGTARIALEEGVSHPGFSDMTLSARIVRRPWDTVGLSGRFDFGGWNGGGGNLNRLNEFTTIKHGDGQFADGNSVSDISRANVNLKRDGTATVVLSGNREWTFEGRWRQTSADRIALRIDTFYSQDERRAFDVPGAIPDSFGGGEIRLDGTRLVLLQLSGRRGDRDFTATFEPQVIVNTDNTGGWNDGGWNGGGVYYPDGYPGGYPGGWPDGRGGGRPRDSRDGNWNRGWDGDNKGGGNKGGDKGHGNGPGANHPRPEPEPNLHDQWKDWTGDKPKGTLPAPPVEPGRGHGKGDRPTPSKGDRPAPAPQEPTRGGRPTSPTRDRPPHTETPPPPLQNRPPGPVPASPALPVPEQPVPAPPPLQEQPVTLPPLQEQPRNHAGGPTRAPENSQNPDPAPRPGKGRTRNTDPETRPDREQPRNPDPEKDRPRNTEPTKERPRNPDPAPQSERERPRNPDPAPQPERPRNPDPAPQPAREQPRNTAPAPQPERERPRNPDPAPQQPERERPRAPEPAPQPERERPRPAREEPKNTQPAPPPPQEQPRSPQPAPPPQPQQAPVKEKERDKNDGDNKNKGDDTDRPRSRVGKPR